MKTQDIKDYLDEHPDFFVKHPEELLNLVLPSQASVDNLSLADFQRQALQEKYQELHQKLSHICETADFNEKSQLTTYRFIAQIIKQTSQEDLVKLLENSTPRQFDLKQCRLIIWRDSQIKPEIKTQLLRYMDGKQVYFGSINQAESQAIFTKHPESVALVPLNSSQVGFLAFASKDGRFLSGNISDILLKLIANIVHIKLTNLRTK